MNKKKIIHSFILSLFVFSIIHLLYSYNFFKKLDYIVYDSFVKLIRDDKLISKEVAIILIDEASLETLNPIVGRWPWPRAIYSDLLDFLSMGAPKAVLFDILFTENQKSEDSNRISANDVELVLATKEAGFVYHAMQLVEDNEDEYNKKLLNRQLPEEFIEKFSIKNIKSLYSYKQQSNNYYIPFDELYNASHGIGVVEFSPDSDGVFRRTMPIRKYGKNFLPVIGIAPFLNNEKVEISPKYVKIGKRKIPLDKDGKYILNTYKKFNTYSISGIFASLQKIRMGDIENLIIDPMEFKDKIVFIGASAVGVEDLKPTPIAPRTPGVFLHATLASNFLLDDFLKPPNPKATVFAIFLFTILCFICILFLEHFIIKISIPFLLLIVCLSFSLFQFNHNILYSIIAPLASIFLSSIVSFAYLVITEGREKLKVKKMFSQYVSPDVLSDILKNKNYASTDTGKEVDITVLFTDIRSFTSFSDKTSPDKVVEMLNFFFSRMTNIIHGNNGTIDKFIGDAIMAFWGAPLLINDHPKQATITALNMICELNSLNLELKDRGFDIDLKIGIGINTGTAILGNIGSENKLNYTIIGDTVNVASRLEGLTKNYNCPIIISETTYMRLEKDIVCRAIDIAQVRGKDKTIQIYEPISCSL